MKITLLNGNPDAANRDFEDYLYSLSACLESSGHEMETLVLRDMDIRYCRGCWGCWVKTPGRCVIADDSALVCRSAIGSDMLVFASPIIMGFTSALLKRAHDRMIPLIHPYIAIDRGECHHEPRYDRYPLMGLLLEKGMDSDDEDVEIITDIYRRDAINFKTKLAVAELTSRSPEEVAHAIDRVQRVPAG